MFPKYFQDELRSLREQGAEFSKAHPALAPMLSGPQADPDVERLLEGTAFLTAQIRQKLDDEFPQIVHDLLDVIAPHYMQPIPSATIQVFHPKATVKDSVLLPTGVECKSIPIEGTSCSFQTRYKTELHPLSILNAEFLRPPGRPAMIKISFELHGIPLAQWHPAAVRLYLADDFAKAADLYFLLRRHLRGIQLVPAAGGVPHRLSRNALRPVGFNIAEKLVPSPSQANPAFGILQDYFVLPQKFLFLDLVGWETWKSRGTTNRFDVHLELDELPFIPTRITKNSFMLNATPAINLFAHEADPIYVDHHRPAYRVRPSGSNAEHYQIFGFDEVRGFTQGNAQEREYVPFDTFRRVTPTHPIYHPVRKPSTTQEGIDHSLSFIYPPESGLPAPETLSIGLHCTNGNLPAHLKTGDISVHGKECPEYVTFENILPPTPGVPPPVGSDFLWRLVSHLSVGFQSLEKLETLKALLELYIFPDSTEYAALANRKRIDGIKSISVKSGDRLSHGLPTRGRHILLNVREDHFSSRGDLFLFGCMLDVFFANYASINAYTQLSVHSLTGGSDISWPARMGTRPLI